MNKQRIRMAKKLIAQAEVLIKASRSSCQRRNVKLRGEVMSDDDIYEEALEMVPYATFAQLKAWKDLPTTFQSGRYDEDLDSVLERHGDEAFLERTKLGMFHGYTDLTHDETGILDAIHEDLVSYYVSSLEK